MDFNTENKEIEEEEEEEEEYGEDDEEDQYCNFFSYMNSEYPICGKVINHKTVDTVIHYLFQDNNNPPNTEWVSAADELTQEQLDAINEYWIMFSCNDKCGLPMRSKKEIKIQKVLPIYSRKSETKPTYLVQTPQLQAEFFQTSDFQHGIIGKNTLWLPIKYLENKVLLLESE